MSGSLSAPKSYTMEELAARSDALALRIGSKATASALLLACVVVILIGAQSLLSTMESMERDLNEMNEQMATANAGLVVLNKTMDTLPTTAAHLKGIVGSVSDTSAEVNVSATSIEALATSTETLDGRLGSIAESTGEMSTSLEGAAADSNRLGATIDQLNTDIQPLVKTQSEMLQGTVQMRGGLDMMNASLAYTIRIMNYIARPPTGGPMTIRAELPKATLPPIPGLRAEVKPVPAFPRDIWNIYTGP